MVYYQRYHLPFLISSLQHCTSIVTSIFRFFWCIFTDLLLRLILFPVQYVRLEKDESNKDRERTVSIGCCLPGRLLSSNPSHSLNYDSERHLIYLYRESVHVKASYQSGLFGGKQHSHCRTTPSICP